MESRKYSLRRAWLPPHRISEVPLKVRMLVLTLAIALTAVIASVLVFRPDRAPAPAPGSVPIAHEYATAAHASGFPDTATTGVPAGMALKRVPGQVSSGPGWYYDSRGWVEVDGNGADLTGLYIPMNLDVTASDVTIDDVRVVTGGRSSFGISLRHTSGVTIENSDVSGVNTGTGRVADAIDDIYGDSTGLVVKDDNIADWRTAVQVSAGLVTGNYIHSPGYIAGDHVNGIYDTGSTQPLTISGNTIFNSMSQTDDITLEPSRPGRAVANKTITGNLLAGGGYAIYGGSSSGRNNSTSHIVIKDNRFSRLYYPQGGKYGPVAYFDAQGRGNVWTDNVWSGSARSGSVRSASIRDGAVVLLGGLRGELGIGQQGLPLVFGGSLVRP